MMVGHKSTPSHVFLGLGESRGAVDRGSFSVLPSRDYVTPTASLL